MPGRESATIVDWHEGALRVLPLSSVSSDPGQLLNEREVTHGR